MSANLRDGTERLGRLINQLPKEMKGSLWQPPSTSGSYDSKH